MILKQIIHHLLRELIFITLMTYWVLLKCSAKEEVKWSWMRLGDGDSMSKVFAIETWALMDHEMPCKKPSTVRYSYNPSSGETKVRLTDYSGKPSHWTPESMRNFLQKQDEEWQRKAPHVKFWPPYVHTHSPYTYPLKCAPICVHYIHTHTYTEDMYTEGGDGERESQACAVTIKVISPSISNLFFMELL